ncbi:MULTISPECIES: hypothetical protein [unclassified Streptomyces]|uniref:hypothetical protein n=1 Tax=unclassified Streptomyces TaxID=2593676 RepID=UPI002E111173|nr:hypothetical protein OG457_02250 [Streptomyces sp. NBC_01207]
MYRPHGVSARSGTPYLMEAGADGRRLRQVELAPDGSGVRSDPDDSPFNPPVVDMEISEAEFETARLGSRPAERPRDEGGTGGEGEGC